MKFKEVSERAVEIREKYADLQKVESGSRWSGDRMAQGFVGDVGALMKIIMAKEGLREMDDVDEKLKHELSDCLWSVLVLANEYGIDLEKEFFDTMNDLEKRIEVKLKK